ncbi:hypothetical protein RclHR1_03940024 [Rhizophagus clarus]|uniref:F-box domain-containing protein n=1 Tax=Rhizophagus clarus TaxID=94130 RepID=A0A2Z6RDN2_9GLOM|nr:hypothetical protein RclHR1_03940024 [Rhizophagus clarus]GES74057.1 hypothetical protein GLOIN_2v1496673 [Rhizophagus clarus]
MASKLTEDCFDEIIQYINDKNTLHSFLFVNRLFCRKVTPKLWSDPFAFLDHSSPVLVRTYMSCLSDEEKDSLYKCGLKSRIKDTSLFLYPSFLTELDFWPLKSSTEEWVRSVGYDKKVLKMNPFFKYFFRLLLKKCQNIRILRWFTHDKLYIMPNIRTLPRNIFKNIRELHCGNYYLDPNFYYQLSKFCKSLNVLNVSHYYKPNDSHLSDLIKKQNGLQSVTFCSLSGGTSRLIDSLSSQAHSLVSVRLEDTDLFDVSSQGFVVCNNLKTLELLDCRTNDPDKFWEPFIVNYNIHLSKLTLVRTPINPKAIETILIVSCMDLKEITFDKIVVESIPDILNILKSYCTNITYLKIFMIKFYFTQKFFKILPSFTKLKYLIIRNSGLSFGNRFDKLGSYLPKSLRLFDMDLEISAFTLKRFLLKCPAPLERLILNYSVGFTNEHLEVILKYAKTKKNFKSIGFTYRSLPELFIPSFINEATEAKVKKFIEIYDPDDQDDRLF